MSKSGGVFQIDDVTRTMSKGGGCAWCSTHPSSDPPHLAGWLRACVLLLLLCYIEQVSRLGVLGTRVLVSCGVLLLLLCVSCGVLLLLLCSLKTLADLHFPRC